MNAEHLLVTARKMSVICDETQSTRALFMEDYPNMSDRDFQEFIDELRRVAVATKRASLKAQELALAQAREDAKQQLLI